MTETTKQPRGSATLDLAALAVTVRDPAGAVVGTFHVSELPPEVQCVLVLERLASRLAGARDPAARFERLRAGAIRALAAGSASKPLRDHWREATARAVADHVARDRPGEHAAILATARVRTATWGRGTLQRAKTHPEVVAHYRALTGRTEETLDSLLDDSPAPEESRQAAD